MLRSLLATAVLSSVALPGLAHATPFTYSETFTASGKVGNTAFNRQVVTIALTADTAAAYAADSSDTEIDDAGGTITINGVTYVLTGTPGSVLASRDGDDSDAGIALFGNGYLTVGTNSAAFSHYDLASAIQVSGSSAGTFFSFGSFATTANKSISFSSVTGQSTFVAAPVASPVPEPSSLALFGTAALGGGACLRRRLV